MGVRREAGPEERGPHALLVLQFVLGTIVFTGLMIGVGIAWWKESHGPVRFVALGFPILALFGLVQSARYVFFAEPRDAARRPR